MTSRANSEQVQPARSGPTSSARPERSEMLQRVLAKVRSESWLAKQLGIAPQSLWKWRDVPIRHVNEIERIVGIPREKLRPDIFGRKRA